MLDHVEMGDSPDQFDALADEIATFAARVDVAELACRRRPEGRRERIRVARALAELPQVDMRGATFTHLLSPHRMS